MLVNLIATTIRLVSNFALIAACLMPGIIRTEINSQIYSFNDEAIYQTCSCDFCEEIRQTSSVKTYKMCVARKPKSSKKPKEKHVHQPTRTIMIYMAADNDLRPFAARNIQQMANIGSNQNITIVVHLDIRISGNKKITRRYLIEHDQVLHIDPYNPLTQQMDSGNPSTLISFCEWAIKNYISDEYDLILWNHGTGILEPPHGKIINPMDLFVFNPSTHRFDLDRSVGFMDVISSLESPRNVCWDATGNYLSNRSVEPQQRGVCWDDTTGNYLSNRKLEAALETICQKYLNGRKFGIIGFDACLMSMIEVCSFVQKYAQVMVGSEEVELGMGWKYDEVLTPFTREKLDTVGFAAHIVNAYNRTYQSITNDYTLSAIDLTAIDLLERNIDQIAKLLIEALDKQRSPIYQAIKESKNKLLCTHFDEPTYIDLHHFYKNLSNNIKKIGYDNSQLSPAIRNALLAKLEEGIHLIEKLVIANTVGKNLRNARGIAIYFPERGIHSSYQEALFLKSNAWGTLLSRYVFG
jgi:hypothetical protein